MKRYLNVKILSLFVIIAVGTYALTSSWSIMLGVAILMVVADRVVGAWADKKDEQYFGKKKNSDETPSQE
jgi:ABC-type transport system involved in cytochrome bd biosynthesis fused ATPase/permease subunit